MAHPPKIAAILSMLCLNLFIVILERIFLRIANLSGQVVYTQKISDSDTFFPSEIELDLTNQLGSGFYSIMLISGSKASARKLLIQH